MAEAKKFRFWREGNAEAITIKISENKSILQ